MRWLRWLGRIPPRKPRELASVCAWCSEPMGNRDARLIERGAERSHGICPSCAQEWMAEAQRALAVH